MFPRLVEGDWVDPVTRYPVPKDPAANLAWRADLLAMAEEDRQLQVDLYTACSQSLLFFVNFAVFTLRIFEPDSETGETVQAEHRHIPMVTWDIQDRHLLSIEQAIDKGQELLTDKSRDMGATWDHIVVYVHRLLFRAGESHLMISRKEDAVDILDGVPKNYPFGPKADPGTLFGKVDYVLSRLPEWMIPRMSRKKLHLVNLDTSCRIDGESANATAGSSDRRTSLFLDEMAKMKEGESIKRSTRDVTACRLVCSTPNGAGTAYSKWRLSGAIPVFVLPWWEHPEKGAGRYIAQDELGRFRIRSPWYDAECRRRSPKEMAIEIDMDHIGSGNTFFESTVIEQHRARYALVPPRRTMTINFKPSVPEAGIARHLIKRNVSVLQFSPGGPWRVWCPLSKGRPDQTQTYVVSADISMGVGASNSVISIMCRETREKIAEFADANTPPYELAKIACAACIWVGGKTRATLIWENNGAPGVDFGTQVSRNYQYPNIYYDRQPGTIDQRQGKRFGWRSSPEKKLEALTLLRRAYAHDCFINHSPEALDEALTYVLYDGGGVGPAELVEESESARKVHGDRVIADMLCLVAIGVVRTQRAEAGAPQWSIGGRKKEWMKHKRRKAKTEKFDFRHAG